MTQAWSAERLAWSDPELGGVETPRGLMRLVQGFGSGLTVRRGDPPGAVWAVGDRGPNLKLEVAVERYGLEYLRDSGAGDGAKIMPRLDLGPAIAELRIEGGRVELVRTMRLAARSGAPVSGLPIPQGPHARCEPALDLQGAPLAPDPGGADSEGIAALADGGFWIGDEYGPSLLRIDEAGRVLWRWVPTGHEERYEGAGYPVVGVLPQLAAARQINRGFEALSLSPDERWLYLAFQSPLAHPDERAHEAARHVRLWQLDAGTGHIEAQYLYPLDPPESFRRDVAKGELRWSDLKVSEILCDGPGRLLVLERGSETTKIYRVEIDPAVALPAEHLKLETRPSVEELSGAERLELPVLAKSLLFSTDHAPEVSADLEGMAILSASELLLVNDNDFGVEGAETSFWRIRFDRPVFATAG